MSQLADEMVEAQGEAPLSFDTYQKGASTTALYPGQGGFIGLAYAVLGLNGEAGETGEQVKKIWRDDAADIQAKVFDAVDELQRGLKGGQISYDVLIERLRERVGIAFKPEITDERRQKISKELGDTLWYAAQVASELGLDLGAIADENLIKLARRRAENRIHGEGSER